MPPLCHSVGPPKGSAVEMMQSRVPNHFDEDAPLIAAKGYFVDLTTHFPTGGTKYVLVGT